jgi:hypothetical protein
MKVLLCPGSLSYTGHQHSSIRCFGSGSGPRRAKLTHIKPREEIIFFLLLLDDFLEDWRLLLYHESPGVSLLIVLHRSPTKFLPPPCFGSGSGPRRAKLTYKIHSEESSFFSNFWMFFWRTGGFSCSIKVLNRGLSINLIKFLKGKMSTVKYVNFLVIKNLALDPDSITRFL